MNSNNKVRKLNNNENIVIATVLQKAVKDIKNGRYVFHEDLIKQSKFW